MRRLILPEQKLSLRALVQEQLVPPDRGLTVLPINGKRCHLRACSSMHRPIQILGALLPRAVRDPRLLPNRIPAPSPRPFHIDLALLACSGHHGLPRARVFGQHRLRLQLVPRLVIRVPAKVEVTPALVTPPQVRKELAAPPLAVLHPQALGSQLPHRLVRPPTPHCGPWQGCRAQGPLEIVHWLPTYLPLSVFAPPLRIVLEPGPAALLVLPHPAADGLLVHQQNLSHLPVAIALLDQAEGLIPLALMSSHFHILRAADGFLIIGLTQHLRSPASFPDSAPSPYRLR